MGSRYRVRIDRMSSYALASRQTRPRPDEAKALATQVQVQATPGIVRADGPENLKDRGWSVSYEILVPRRSGLTLKANNGGIGISDVEGDISFETLNGGVTLNRLGGDVKGKTTNGGVKVELAGNTWRGNQLDVQTTNGGIHVTMPEIYSARFESSTVNGRVHSEMPGANLTKDRNNREVAVTLGSGGPLVRLVTTNGGHTFGQVVTKVPAAGGGIMEFEPRPKFPDENSLPPLDGGLGKPPLFPDQ